MPQRRVPAGNRKGGQYLPNPPKPPVAVGATNLPVVQKTEHSDPAETLSRSVESFTQAGEAATQARASGQSIRPFIQGWGRLPTGPDDREGEYTLHDPSQISDYSQTAPKVIITGDPESGSFQATLQCGKRTRVLSSHESAASAVEAGKDHLANFVATEDKFLAARQIWMDEHPPLRNETMRLDYVRTDSCSPALRISGSEIKGPSGKIIFRHEAFITQDGEEYRIAVRTGQPMVGEIRTAHSLAGALKVLDDYPW